MSPIGKIFVILNLFLAAAFLGWASSALATNQNYKSQLETLTLETDADIARLEGLVTEKTRLISDNDAAMGVLEGANAGLNEDVKRLTSDLTAARDQNTTLEGSIDELRSSLSSYNDRLESLSDSRDRAEDARRQAESERNDAADAAEAAQLAQNAAEEERDNTQQALDDTRTELNSTSVELDRTQLQLAMLADQTGTSLNDITAVPPIDAYVTSVRSMDTGPGIVALSVGANDDVKAGMQFQIFDGPDYKGSVIVETVRPDMCSARIVDELMPMSQGDSAATRL